MGALVVYVIVYFAGYYAAHLVNILTGRMLIRNRRAAGLASVWMTGLMHGYKIISTPAPAGHHEGSGQALALYVIMPVIVITVAVLYLLWQNRQDDTDNPDHS
jgi:surface polysaccharide O-acyltransferase-like enzyme